MNPYKNIVLRQAGSSVGKDVPVCPFRDVIPILLINVGAGFTSALYPVYDGTCFFKLSNIKEVHRLNESHYKNFN
jgi:hypothetical protein